MLKKAFPFAFILLWIVPVGWVGLMRDNYPLYPNWIAPLFRVSGVFESAPRQWRIFFIETLDSSGWHGLDEKELFASTPLGNRSRLQPILTEIARSKSSGDMPRLLGWIWQRAPQVEHFSEKIKAVRIVHAAVPPEMFLQCATLPELYQRIREEHISLVVDAVENANP